MTRECPYCGKTEGLRVACDGGGYIAPEYTCEGCFTPRDDGPCFDDLPPVLAPFDAYEFWAALAFPAARSEAN